MKTQQNVVIAGDVEIGNGVIIGNNVTIYPKVKIGDGCRIMDGAVIGRLTHRTSSVSRSALPDYQPTIIGEGSVIGCHTALYTGITIGREVLLADGVSIREDCVIGDEVLLGRYVTLNYNASIGKRTKIMDYTHITGNASVGEDCFVSIQVGTANDNDVYLRRFGLHQTDDDVKGPTIEDYVVIGMGAKLNPDVHIGYGSMVGTGAIVTRNVPPWSLAIGVPARVISQIKEEWREAIISLASSKG